MRTKYPVYFNQRYYFDKEELGRYIIENILSSKEDSPEITSRKEELFDLYRSGRFERFCGLKPTETELIPALQAIKECFGLSTNFTINFGSYCSITGIDINLSNNLDESIEIRQLSQDSFNVSPYSLSLDTIQNGIATFRFHYDVHKIVTQTLDLSLRYFLNEQFLHKYTSTAGELIDLSQKGGNSISFEIPMKDIISQNEGYYFLMHGAFVIASVRFPRCGLPVSGGIYSFPKLQEFCRKLDGSPTNDLLSFYKIINSGILDAWLQDNQEEGECKKKISECVGRIRTKGQFKINDINSILQVVSQRAVSFPLLDYINIVQVDTRIDDPDSLIRTDASHNHFIKWKSNSGGKISIYIRPKENVLNWNLDFNLVFFVGGKRLNGGPISFNLSNFEDGEYCFEFYFKCDDFSKQHMGTYQLSIMSGRECIKTDCSFSITGEIIDLKLPGNVSFPMVGIMYDKGNFYIAQTPITQEQLCVIVNEDKNPIYGDIKSALLKSVDTLKGKNYPATHLTFYDCFEIMIYLRDLFHKTFYIPSYQKLLTALCNGFCDESVNFDTTKKHKQILEVRKNHSTKLGVFDLLNNIYLYTSDTISHVFKSDGRVVFGSTYFQIDNITKRELCEEDIDDYSYFGFCPIAFDLVQPVENSSNDEDNHTSNSGSQQTESTSWNYESSIDVDDRIFNQRMNEPDF